MSTIDMQGMPAEDKNLLEDVSRKLRDLAREFESVLDRLKILGSAPEGRCPSLRVDVEGSLYVLTRLPAQGASKLTHREQEVAELAAQGLACKTIARLLGISESTAAAHIRHIFSKLGVHSRAELAWRVVGTAARE